MNIPHLAVQGTPEEMRLQLRKHTAGYTIVALAAIRDMSFQGDCYSADFKRFKRMVSDRLISYLKIGDYDTFWRYYKEVRGAEVDWMGELVDELFRKLDIETIDPLSELLK